MRYGLGGCLHLTTGCVDRQLGFLSDAPRSFGFTTHDDLVPGRVRPTLFLFPQLASLSLALACSGGDGKAI